MEFDKPSDKYMFIAAMVVVAGVCGALITGCIKMTNDMQRRHDQYQADCKALDPKYSGDYTAKSGPFEGVEMIARDFTTETVGLETKYGSDTKVRWFLCNDVVKVTK